MLNLRGLDHLVLTVKSVEKTQRFYCDNLGFEKITFNGGRVAVLGGSQKINLHQLGAEFCPHAKNPVSGSADICLIYDNFMNSIIDYLNSRGVKIEDGPVTRTGAAGPIKSVYIRDPDKNLIELSTYYKDDM